MRRVGAALLVVLLAGCFATGGNKDDPYESPPDLAAGYSWTWESKSPVKTFSNQTGVPLTSTITLLREWQTDTGEVYHPSERGFLASEVSTAFGLDAGFINIVFLRSADLRLESMTSPSTLKADVQCIEYRFQFDAPAYFLMFPMKPGKTWHNESRLDANDSHRDTSGRFVIDAKVIGREAITVAAGTFDDAMRLEFTYRVTGSRASEPDSPLTVRPTVMHYSPTAKNIVRAEFPILSEMEPNPGQRPSSRFFSYDEAPPGGAAVMELVSYSFVERVPTTLAQETALFMPRHRTWDCPE